MCVYVYMYIYIYICIYMSTPKSLMSGSKETPSEFLPAPENPGSKFANEPFKAL